MNLHIVLAWATWAFAARAKHFKQSHTNSQLIHSPSEREDVKSFNENYKKQEKEVCGFGSSHWEAYQKMHEAGRKALARGESPPILLWHCRSHEDCRGNGDQIKGLITAFYLAVATSRILVVDWSRNGYNLAKLFAPRYIDTSLTPNVLFKCIIHKEIHWWAASAPPDPVAALSAMPEKCVSIQSNVPPHKFAPKSLKIPKSMHNLWGCAFNFMFQRSEPLSNLLAAHIPPRNMGSKQKTIGVHLRFGDLTWGNHMYNMQPTEQALTAALQCAARFVESLRESREDSWSILVVTDNFEIKKLIATIMKQGHKPGTPEVFTTVSDSGTIAAPMHTNFMKDAGDSAQVQNSMLDAWADQLNLAQTSGILATQGGFAIAAAELGLLPRQAVWLYEDNSGFCGVHPGTEHIVSSKS